MKKRIVFLVACFVVLMLLCVILFSERSNKAIKSDVFEVSTPGDVPDISGLSSIDEEDVDSEVRTEEFETTGRTEEVFHGTESGLDERYTEDKKNSETTESEEYIVTTEQISEEILSTATTQCDNNHGNTTEHKHTFVERIEKKYHPEVGHFEEYCVNEGYTEELYQVYSYYCYSCGAIMDDWDTFSVMEHSGIHGAYGTANVVVGTIEHPAVYEEVWVVDKEAYYEEVITNICSQCGYVE